jgi:CrcB protein
MTPRSPEGSVESGGIVVRVLLHIGLVAFGSAVGGLARWGIHLGISRYTGTKWPWGTFFINVTGCLFLGWFATILLQRTRQPGGWPGGEEWRLLLAVGFAGGYTTFSTFGLESDLLFRAGEGLSAFLYLGFSVLLGLLAIRLGSMLAGGV